MPSRRVFVVSLFSSFVAACGSSEAPASFAGTGGLPGSSGTAGSTGIPSGAGAVGSTSSGGQASQSSGGALAAGGKSIGNGGASGGGAPGASGSLGAGGTSQTAGATGAGGSTGAGGAAGAGGAPSNLDHFSFFVTSLAAIQRVSGSQSGFGGDLTFGETGAGAGLRGADKICATIAETSMPGSGAKQWRAFLSASTGGADGGPVNAIDRVGNGPWYDRLGRVVAMTKSDLAMTRPGNADAAIANDLPNEDGVPNHAPDPTTGQVDNHDILTGSTTTGTYYGSTSATCKDWTSKVGSDGTPRVGHSWPRVGGPGGGPGGGQGGRFGGMGNMNSWASALDEAGCAPGVSIVEMGPPDPTNPTVGSGGGYGGFYCFALTP